MTIEHRDSNKAGNERISPSSQNGSATTRMNAHFAWLLAAPHTWPASIMPAFVSAGAASANTASLSVSLTCTLLVICILMQSAVNTFNDYFDFIKGADSAEDNVEPTDAVLVYNNIDPKSALHLAVGFLLTAFLLGIYVVSKAGWIPLAIAAVGAIFVVLYSGGKTPISYLPVGELVSGFVMGGLIPLACYQVLTLRMNWLALIWAIPTIIGVGLIMMTNNTCDIEKDIQAKRNTLPVKLGRKRSCKLYHALIYAWCIAVTVIVAAWFRKGLIVVPFMLLACYPFLKAMLQNPLSPATRISAMSQICTLNVALGGFYAAALFASNGMTLLL